MNCCTSCGMPVPEGQTVCSMCYGDIDYGRDGYYRQWVEEQERKRMEEEQADETTYELCPHCGDEVEIPADAKSLCPSCGREILPCSTCYDDLPGWRDCNWTEKNGCWRFPAGRKEG